MTKSGRQLDREIAETLARSRARYHHAERKTSDDAWDVAMDAILEGHPKKAAQIVRALHEEHGTVEESPRFAKALREAPQRVRDDFFKLVDTRPVTRFQLIDYDVWGNPRDGFEINQSFTTGTYMEIPVGANDAEIIRILKSEGLIKKTARKESIEIESDEDHLYFRHRSTGRPEFELRAVR